jgi:hypothetical protein
LVKAIIAVSIVRLPGISLPFVSYIILLMFIELASRLIFETSSAVNPSLDTTTSGGAGEGPVVKAFSYRFKLPVRQYIL